MNDPRQADKDYMLFVAEMLEKAKHNICPFRKDGSCQERFCQAWCETPPYPVRGAFDFCTLCRLKV